MKKILIGTMFTIMILTGCQKADDKPVLETIEYSNLTDDSVKNQLSDIMTDAGISKERQRIFFDHVDQFNSSVSGEGMAGEFEKKGVVEEKYDPYTMQEQWNESQSDFFGYNCRITSFGLFGDYVEIPIGEATKTDMVTMDMMALDEDSSALLNEGDYERFLSLYSTVPTDKTQDIATHVENLQKDWDRRGIAFDNHSKARLISVVFHDSWEDIDQLFIGHIGVLFPVSENELYFVEKIAFQEPYQLIKFSDRVELNDYLMAKYDVSYGQPTAAPFIMENNKLIEGYRPNPNKNP